jgi:U3 small nucleolar RNA-associated protein 3
LLEDRNDGGDDDLDDDEVFALRGMPDDEDDSEGDAGEDEDEDEDGMDVDEQPAQETRKAGKKKSKKALDLEEEEESEEERWGKGRAAYYASNAADIDSDDEEANMLEEQEAIRLQTKVREGMTDDDFGLGDLKDLPSKQTAVSVPAFLGSVHISDFHS